jgi:hypothetical protein
MVKIGYVRVSSADQNEERQIKKMLELGIEERMIFVDKQSGKDFERPGYQTMKRILRKGIFFILTLLIALAGIMMGSSRNGNRLRGKFKQILWCWKTKHCLIAANIER